MKLKPWIIPVLSIELLTLAFRLWQQGHEMDDLQSRVSSGHRTLLAVHEAERTRLETEAQQAREKTAAIETELAATRAAQSSGAETNAGKTSESVLVDAGSEVTPVVLQQWLTDANDPTVMRRLNLEARNQTLRRYGDLLDQLKLEPQQAVQLTMLLADKRQSAVDVAVTTYHYGEDLSHDASRYRAIVAAADAKIDEQIKTLIGESNYAQYRTYDTKLGQNNVLQNVELALRDSTDPLSPEQSTRIKSALQESNGTRITAKLVLAAKEFLSPLQLQTLQDLRAVQEASDRKDTQQLRAIPTPLPIDPKDE